MLRNYIKIALRNIIRHKGFSTINILGLAIGIAGCIVISLFIIDELKYDKFIAGSDNVYRIYDKRTDESGVTYTACVPPAYANFIKRQYPEVESTARILMSSDRFLFEVNNKKAYEEKGWFVDSSFFKVLPLPFISGSGPTALEDPFTIVLSEELASRYFGNDDPVGKTVQIDKDDFLVTGVMKTLPDQFHLRLNFLMSMPSARIASERMERWSWHQFFTYVRLKDGSDIALLQDKFQKHIKTEILPLEATPGSEFMPYFQEIKDVHLRSADFVYDNSVRGNIVYVKGLGIIAVFVLIIACFNFINLSTAKSFQRAKEIGVRKAVGAERSQLIIQFLSETILLSIFATLIATIISLFVIPLLNDFTGKEIYFNPLQPVWILILFAVSLVTGVLAGIYPALILSGFNPVTVLKSSTAGPNLKSGWLRQGLVVVQFALSALLIVSTVVVYRQIHFLNSKELGFDKDQIIYFQARDQVENSIESFKSELLKLPGIASVTYGYGLPGDQFAGESLKIPGENNDREFPSNVFFGDHDYIKTMGLKIIAGRDFSRVMQTDIDEAFIINETAVRDFGFESPEKAIGRSIQWVKWMPDSVNPVKKGKVIGVVEDFHYKSLHEKVTSSVIHMYPQVLYKVAVKLNSNNIERTLSSINGVWNRFSPGYPIDYKFMDETFGSMYQSEEKLSTMLWIFTIMAITIGCMGLFALAAFSAQQRTREIGIRKVLGAGTLNIFTLLSKRFLILIGISCMVALPAGYLAMDQWLMNFPYRVALSWWIFASAALIILIIALVTISFQAIKAALVNPVTSLRTE